MRATDILTVIAGENGARRVRATETLTVIAGENGARLLCATVSYSDDYSSGSPGSRR